MRQKGAGKGGGKVEVLGTAADQLGILKYSQSWMRGTAGSTHHLLCPLAFSVRKDKTHMQPVRL